MKMHVCLSDGQQIRHKKGQRNLKRNGHSAEERQIGLVYRVKLLKTKCSLNFDKKIKVRSIRYEYNANIAARCTEGRPA